MTGLIVAACGGTGQTVSPVATLATSTPEPTASPSTFASAIYKYSIALPGGWALAQSATQPWDGTDVASHEDVDVDLFASHARLSWVYGAPTSKTLEALSADMTAADVVAHQCSATPEVDEAMTVGGEPGRLTVKRCPANGGIFVANVTVIHSGIGYFFYLQHPEGFPDSQDDLAVFKGLLTGVTFR